jgi:hypothetical protein
MVAGRLTEQRYTQKMRALTEFLKIKQIGRPLQVKIRRVFEHRYPHKTWFDEHEVLMDLPPEMRRKLVGEIYGSIIKKTLLFDNLECDAGPTSSGGQRVHLNLFPPCPMHFPTEDSGGRRPAC